jgi:hypothetical protein
LPEIEIHRSVEHKHVVKLWSYFEAGRALLGRGQEQDDEGSRVQQGE